MQLFKKTIYASIALLLLILPFVAQAQVTIKGSTGTTFGLGDADLEDSIINTVQWILGFLGLIAVIMIIAAVAIGAVTDDRDRAETARKALISAIIGLVVVLLAWAIVTFVIARTAEVTQ